MQHIEELGVYAFYKCHGLTAAPLTKIKRIGSGAFYDTGIATVTGMDSLENVQGNVFSETPFWRNYRETSGEELFICNNILIFARGCGKRLEIPQGVTEIAPGAFSQEQKICTVIFPESIKEIGESAFDERTGLERVYMPAGDVRIGHYAFGREKWGLEIYLVSDGVAQEPNPDFLVAGNTLLSYRGEDADVVVPDNVKIIGEEAFDARTDIVSVSLPEGITQIGARAFCGCEFLEKVSMPSTAISIGYGAFQFCTALKDIDLQYVQEIEEEAFYACVQLSAVELSNIRSIGTEAFANSGVARAGGMERLTDFGERIFEGTPLFGENAMRIVGHILFDGKRCEGDIVIPDGVEVIAKDAFSGAKITSVTCPDTLREIGEGAFCGCAVLEKFSMGDFVVTLGEYAFYEDAALSDMRLSANLKTIPATALKGCHGLQMLTIPQGCDVKGLFFLPDGWQKERDVRLLTIAPTRKVPEFLQDSFMQGYRIYTTQMPEGTEWADAANHFGWSIFLLELTEKEITLRQGEEHLLIFNSGAKADWHSENEEIVRVSKDGRLYAKSAGWTDVVAVVYGKEYRCRVTVE